MTKLYRQAVQVQTSSNRELTVRNGKGNKTRIVLLSDKVARLIREYLKHERERYRLYEVSPYLFLSNRNRQLSRITVLSSSQITVSCQY